MLAESREPFMPKSPRLASVLSQKFADKVVPFRAAVPQPRQGRKMVAQGANPGGRGPHPVRRLTDTPLPRGRERGRGRGRVCLPTADAVGYPLSPRQVGADFINQLLAQDTPDVPPYPFPASAASAGFQRTPDLRVGTALLDVAPAPEAAK
jgi:hypothetical protein